ncbi:hypothetical protein [Tardibacter chloracetimidivorans]|uniref:hypothetical protein n=1 Tax=Tardibacter chloracetimidivorans TaxID=1921510 RepID=UPI0013018166|nr:hypothetical protein [Tardibacter chloracetimidivorans]
MSVEIIKRYEVRDKDGLVAGFVDIGREYVDFTREYADSPFLSIPYEDFYYITKDIVGL